MRKLKNSKGFTLMEMLIVVAIIAVLIAIAIPTFLANLNKARIATDEANIRSGYASAMADMLTNDNAKATTYYLLKDGSVSENASSANVYKTVGDASKKNDINIAGQNVTGWSKDQTASYVCTVDGDQIKVEIKVGTTTTTTPGT